MMSTGNFLRFHFFLLGIQHFCKGVQINGTMKAIVDESKQVHLRCNANLLVHSLTWYNETSGMQITDGVGNKTTVFPYTYRELRFTPRWYHDGTFVKCRAVFSDRFDEKSVKLTVYHKPGKPTLTAEPGTTAREGESVCLTCATVPLGNPVANYTIEAEDKVFPGNYLCLHNMSRKTERLITCTARNMMQSIQSDPIHLNIQYAPNVITTSVSAVESQDVVILCKAEGNPQANTFADWLHLWGDQFIRKIDGHNSGNLLELKIVSASYNDAGTYVCNVTNNVSDIHGQIWRTGNVSLDIQGRPLIITPAVGTVVQWGENVTLSQEIYIPIRYFTYTWFFCGHPVIMGDHYSIFFKEHLTLQTIYKIPVQKLGFMVSLFIKQIQEDMFGVYSVNICSEVGCTWADITVKPSGPPLQPTELHILNITSDKVWLTWLSKFDGGHAQTFLLLYKPDNQTINEWQELNTTDPGRGSNVTVMVSGLAAKTRYIFRLISVNEISESHFNFSSEDMLKIILRTKATQRPMSPVPATLIAAVAGLAFIFASSLFAALLVTIAFRPTATYSTTKARLHSMSSAVYRKCEDVSRVDDGHVENDTNRFNSDHVMVDTGAQAKTGKLQSDPNTQVCPTTETTFNGEDIYAKPIKKKPTDGEPLHSSLNHEHNEIRETIHHEQQIHIDWYCNGTVFLADANTDELQSDPTHGFPALENKVNDEGMYGKPVEERTEDGMYVTLLSGTPETYICENQEMCIGMMAYSQLDKIEMSHGCLASLVSTEKDSKQGEGMDHNTTIQNREIAVAPLIV